MSDVQCAKCECAFDWRSEVCPECGYSSNSAEQVERSTIEWSRWKSFHSAINNGYEYFKYMGPNDAATLPLCSHLVGKIWSADELAGFRPDGHEEGEVFVFGGGNGCRHSLQPVRREWFEGDEWTRLRGGTDDPKPKVADERRTEPDIFAPKRTGPSRQDYLNEGICPGCHDDVDVNTTATCPHCGEHINEYLHVPSASPLDGAGRWVVVGVVMAVGFFGLFLLSALMDWVNEPTPEPREVAKASSVAKPDRSVAEVPHTGEVGYLWQDGVSVVAVTVSEEALDAFIDASVKNDTHGTQNLMSAGLVGVAWGNTKARVLDAGWTVVKVRILEGKFEGQAVWTVVEAVHREPNRDLPKGLGLHEGSDR